MTVNGEVFGVKVIGNITPTEVKNFAEVAEAVAQLRTSLTKVFNAEFADTIIHRMGESKLLIEDGKISEELQNQLRMLAAEGAIFKSIDEQ